MVWGKQGGGDEMKWFGLEDVGAALLYKSLMGTFALYEDAAVLTHQNTVRKDRRLYFSPILYRGLSL